MRKILYCILIVGILILSYFSVMLFTDNLTISNVFEAIFNYDSNNVMHYLVRDIKIPRLLGAILAGAFLAISGAIMQCITRNNLADPSLVGINDGAAFGLSIGLLITNGNISYIGNVFFSLLGALVSTCLVFLVSSRVRGRAGKIVFILAGSSIGVLLKALSNAISLFSGDSLTLDLWYSSGVSGIKWQGVFVLLVGIVGVIIAFIFARKFTILGMGDEMATSLGVNVKFVNGMAITAIVIMTSVAISVVGNIGFLGLIVPNILRIYLGNDYKKIIPLSLVTGSFLFLLADVLGRTINAPYEVSVAAISSLIGVPFFLYLVNSKKGAVLNEAK